MCSHRLTSRCELLALLTAGAMLGSSVLSLSAQERHILNPDPRIQQYLGDNADEIRQLQAVIENQHADAAARKAALSKLGLISEDVAVEQAAKLVNDPSQEIAQAAIDLLSDAVVMAGHGVPGSHLSGDHPVPASVWAQYVDTEHKIVLDALSAATKDPRPQIALTALKSLVRLSDEVAVKAVQDIASKGQITEAQAVSICAQSASDLARACVLNYLDHGSPDGKAAAIDVLGTVPALRPMIRNKIFLNSNADPKLRTVAANVLGAYDPLFTSYALSITTDPKLPVEVYVSTLTSYVQSAKLNGKLDSALWGTIKEALNNKIGEMQSDQFQDKNDVNLLLNLRDRFALGRPEL